MGGGLSPAGDGLTVARCSGLAALARESAGWQRLCADAMPPCNEPAWTLAHAAAFRGADDVFALAVRDERGELVGWLPLAREPGRAWWALRRARHAADGHFDSEMLEPLCARGREREIVAALLTALARERGLHALVLSCAPVGSAPTRALLDAVAARGWPLRREPRTYLVAPLEPSFEETLAKLRSRVRSKLRQALRSIDERGARARFVERADELAPALDALYELHQARWNAEGRPGSFADARRRAFYARWTADALAAGRLRLALLERDGRALAAQIGIATPASNGAATPGASDAATPASSGGARPSTYTQIQEGYDPRESEWRPATALRAWAVRALCEQGVRQLDFQEGDAPHKRDWGGVEVPCETLVVALPRWRARAEFALRARLGR
ncbi:MAG: GNAT family N-acetyltransferase [Planctomycetota bacterium]|nr:MAG: GNAT family N-acetyltransferase [Planctomycetota bacterium]